MLGWEKKEEEPCSRALPFEFWTIILIAVCRLSRVMSLENFIAHAEHWQHLIKDHSAWKVHIVDAAVKKLRHRPQEKRTNCMSEELLSIKTVHKTRKEVPEKVSWVYVGVRKPIMSEFPDEYVTMFGVLSWRRWIGVLTTRRKSKSPKAFNVNFSRAWESLIICMVWV